MSCGVCQPALCAETYGLDGHNGRIFGYAYPIPGYRLDLQIRDLYFFGAEHVFLDVHRSSCPYFHRPGAKSLMTVVRPGCGLLICSPKVLAMGKKNREAIADVFSDLGVQIFERRKTLEDRLREARA